MRRRKQVAAMFTAAAMVVLSVFGNYAPPMTALAEGETQVTDADLDDLFNEISYSRDSVHDPSIVVDNSSGTKTYYVFGSHMGVSKTTDLMNWTNVTGEKEDSTLFGKIVSSESEAQSDADSTDTIVPVSYKEAFTDNAYKGTVTILVDGVETEVEFGTYNASEWNTALSGYTVQGNMWAPDVIYNPTMEKWCMYLSLNGSTWNSVIILLTADSIEGPYVYQGPIIYSGFNGNNTDIITYDKTDLSLVYPGITDIPGKYKVGNSWGTLYPHAIDPCVSYDEAGNLWMTYGSWSGGIYIIELDEKTGLRDYTVTYPDVNVGQASCSSDAYFGTKIAGGAYVSGEGSYIEKIGNYWYLFMSYGFYSPDGGYEMRVFRSENINGPYVDGSGQSACYSKYEMNYGVNGTKRGEKLMSGYQWDTMDLGEISQGHNSAFVDDNGNAYVIYHTKFNDGTAGHQLRVHQLYINEDGWLTVAPYEYSGETINDSTLASTTWEIDDIVGDYQVIIHKYGMDYENLEKVLPSDIVLHTDGSISGDYTGSWEITTGSYVNITLGEVTYKGELVEQTVDGFGIKTLCFTAASSSGVNVWGSKSVDASAAIAYTRNQLNLQNAAAIFPISGNVFDNVTLPTKGYLGATVTWSSSNEAVLSSEGVVTVPDNDTEVSMTCTVSKDGSYYEKVYDVIVMGINSHNGDTETGKVALFEFEDSYVDSINSIEGSVVTQENATAPSIKTDSAVHSKVVQINFGYNDAGTSNYISIPNPLKGNTTNEATISLLVKRGDTDVWDALWGIVDADSSDGIEGRLYLTPNAYLGFNGTGGWFDANHASTVTNAIPVSEWSLVTVALDSKGYDIYVDGALKYTETYNNTFGSSEDFASYQSVMNLIASADDFYLGYGSWWGSAPFRADDLTFYSRVLSENDVAKLYEDFQKKMNPTTTETLNKTETTVYSDNDLTVGSKTDGVIDTMVWYDYTKFYGVQASGDFSVNWKFTNEGGTSNWLHYIISVTTDLARTAAS
ncbi:MAG: lipocalin-like domain-containing protein, partial [Lachnospiraceae bacterium]